MQIMISSLSWSAKIILNDRVMFPTFQMILFLLFFYAWIKDCDWFRSKSGVSLNVKRGEESWSNFNLMYGFLALLIVQVNATAESLKGYKTLITILDLSSLFYLCFFNGWFRNKSIGIINASKSMVENK